MPSIPTAIALKTAAGATLLTIPSTGYEAITWANPSRSRRRVVLQGQHTPGEVELSSVLDTATLTFGVRIVGSTWSQVQTREDALIAAVEQDPGWLITVTLGGVTRTWEATGAGNLTFQADREADALRWSNKENVTITVPANPYPS